MGKFAGLRSQLGIVRSGAGITAYIKRALVYLLAFNVQDAEYPNKIGDQDRVAAGGEVFPGRALAFDGVDQEAHVADNGALDVNQASTDFCISANFKSNNSGLNEYTVGKNINAAVDGRYGFFKDTNNVVNFRFETSIGTTTVPTSIDGDSDTDKHLFVARIDLSGSKVYIYTDGVLENLGGTAFTGTFPTLINAYEFILGASSASGGASFQAFAETEINDVRIYHKDITSAANLASLQKGEALGDEVAWWFCEGNSTTRVDESSGNDYHLTAVNFDSTSFVEGMYQSLFNKFGYYNDSGTYISPDMSTAVNDIPVDDVDGNTLTFAGQAQYPMAARDAASFTGDGSAYFTITGLLTTDVITALSTDVPTCTINGRLDIAGGDVVWGVTVTRGSTWAYYPICEGQGGSIYDVTGNGRHGVGTNVANNNWTVQDLPDEDFLAEHGANFVGNFNGTDDVVNCGTDSNLHFTDSFTISFWAKDNNTDHAFAYLICNRANSIGSENGYAIMYDTVAGDLISYSGADTTYDIGSLVISKTVFDLITVVFDKTNSEISGYKNGGLIATISESVIPGTITTDFLIGKAPNSSSQSFSGQLRDLEIWDRALSPTEVLSIFNGNSPSSQILDLPITGLSDTETDESGNGVDGTWSGTGLHSSIIPALSDKSADALGQPIQYPQSGKNLIPHTYLSMPENIRELYDADQEVRWEEKTSGDVVIGEEYLIIKRTIVDFTTVGAANNNVGTTFTASSTGITLSTDDILGLKTTQTGNNLIDNGGARNAIGALITTDWDKTTGLYDIDAFSDYASVIDGATKVETSEDLLSMVPQGAEEVTNGDFALWTGDDPDNFVLQNEVGSDPEISEVGSSEGHGGAGTGACNFYGSSSTVSMYQTPVATTGKYCLITVNVSNYISGTLQVYFGAGSLHYSISGAGRFQFVTRTNNAVAYLYLNSGGGDITIDEFSVKELQVLGSDLVTDGDFGDVTPAAAKGVAGITKATPGVVTFDPGHGYADGDVIYFSGLTEMTELNTEYWILRANSGDTFELQTTVGNSLDTSGYGSAETTGGNVAQLTDLTSWAEGVGWHPGVDGAGALTNVAHCDGSQGGVSNLQQSAVLTDIGDYFLLKFTISNYSAGLLNKVYFGDGGSRTVALGANGTYSILGQGITSNILYLQTDVDFIGSIDNVSVHKLTWGRQITDDSTNYSGFQFALPIDEFDFAIPVSYVAESIGAQQFHDGLADGWSLSDDQIITSIVDGNGFSGKTQRFEVGAGSLGFIYAYVNHNIIPNGESAYIYVKGRWSAGVTFSMESGNPIITETSAQTGDATEFTAIAVATSDRTTLRIYFYPNENPPAGTWVEIDELEFRRVIDGRWYEPESLGGSDVIVQSDDVIGQYRYLTEYCNPNGKDLMLIAVDAVLDYSDHDKILRYVNLDD